MESYDGSLICCFKVRSLHLGLFGPAQAHGRSPGPAQVGPGLGFRPGWLARAGPGPISWAHAHGWLTLDLRSCCTGSVDRARSPCTTCTTEPMCPGSEAASAQRMPMNFRFSSPRRIFGRLSHIEHPPWLFILSGSWAKVDDSTHLMAAS